MRIVFCKLKIHERKVHNTGCALQCTFAITAHVARDLIWASYIDSDLLIRTYAQHTVTRYFAVLLARCPLTRSRRWCLVYSADMSGFRQQHAGRSSGLLGSPIPVAAECGCTTEVPSQPIDYITDALVSLQPLLAARAGASSVQVRRSTYVQSFARTRAAIPQSTQSRH